MEKSEIVDLLMLDNFDLIIFREVRNIQST